MRKIGFSYPNIIKSKTNHQPDFFLYPQFSMRKHISAPSTACLITVELNTLSPSLQRSDNLFPTQKHSRRHYTCWWFNGSLFKVSPFNPVTAVAFVSAFQQYMRESSHPWNRHSDLCIWVRNSQRNSRFAADCLFICWLNCDSTRYPNVEPAKTRGEAFNDGGIANGCSLVVYIWNETLCIKMTIFGAQEESS